MPRRLRRNPPRTAPAMPMIIVTITPPGSGPGIANLIQQGGGANPATLKKLADVLGVRPTDLLKQER